MTDTPEKKGKKLTMSEMKNGLSGTGQHLVFVSFGWQ